MLEGRLIDKRFRGHWKNYLLQCALCMLALLVVLLIVDVVLRAAIVVAIWRTSSRGGYRDGVLTGISLAGVGRPGFHI